jgi:hypothetical protein
VDDLCRKDAGTETALRGGFTPWSVVIPDERPQSERLQSIATIQKRLQALLDEGRMLRQAIEESGEMTPPVTLDTQDSALRIRDEIVARGKTNADS